MTRTTTENQIESKTTRTLGSMHKLGSTVYSRHVIISRSLEHVRIPVTRDRQSLTNGWIGWNTGEEDCQAHHQVPGTMSGEDFKTLGRSYSWCRY